MKHDPALIDSVLNPRKTSRAALLPMNRRGVLALLAAIATAGPAARASVPCDFTPDFGPVDQAVRTMLARFPSLPGAAVFVGDADGTLHEAYFGGYEASTIVPVASATKLLSGVAIATLADAGTLDIDAPVRQYLPDDFSFQNAGLKATMTVRQMFAHTSGLPGEDAGSSVLSSTDITLAEAVQQIACCVPLEDTPGASFAYGGLSMHVGGRVAEVVSGEPWEVFFSSAVAVPLGLTSVDYQGLAPFTTNPRIAGGARSNLRDYARVVTMLLRGGEIDGVRILSAETVDGLLIDQTVGLPRRDPPPAGAEGYGYGFGGWVSLADAQGGTAEFTSPGAFGFTPWIDLERGIAAVILVEGVRGVLLEDLDAIQAAVREAVDGCGVCDADLDGNGSLSFADVQAFVVAFRAGSPGADLTGDGTVSFADVQAFVRAYNAGC